MVMRGGTSKGAYFLAEELPADASARDDLLLRVMGTPDPRQIDGIGGAHPLTSKVAVVSAAADDDADVDYLFLQVGVEKAFVTDQQNCGNLLAGIGPFAIERGLVNADGTEAVVRIRMLNTGGVATATFPVRDGLPVYDGDCAIAGVPGTAAPIRLDFEDTAGSTCGALLPTGNVVDVIDGVEVTCIDNGMPVVVLRADDLGVAGDESCAELEANELFRSAMEYKGKGFGNDFILNQRRAEMLLREILEKYPNSDKIADVAYQLGEVYESRAYKQYDRAAKYYERSFQWVKGSRTDARMRAAVLYDRQLNERAKAIELYRDEIAHDTDGERIKQAERRLGELVGNKK
jgi:2-methylaconitate cis-trans-isomerase PrpF